jgi:hypothetical protein
MVKHRLVARRLWTSVSRHEFARCGYGVIAQPERGIAGWRNLAAGSVPAQPRGEFVTPGRGILVIRSRICLRGFYMRNFCMHHGFGILNTGG